MLKFEGHVDTVGGDEVKQYGLLFEAQFPADIRSVVVDELDLPRLDAELAEALKEYLRLRKLRGNVYKERSQARKSLSAAQAQARLAVKPEDYKAGSAVERKQKLEDLVATDSAVLMWTGALLTATGEKDDLENTIEDQKDIIKVTSARIAWRQRELSYLSSVRVQPRKTQGRKLGL